MMNICGLYLREMGFGQACCTSEEAVSRVVGRDAAEEIASRVVGKGVDEEVASGVLTYQLRPYSVALELHN